MSPYEDAERLMTECEHLRGLLSKQQAVVDAARPYMCAGDDCTCDLCIALRALDGEPCPDCADGIAPKGGNEGSTRYICPTCGGRGYFRHENWKPCPTCRGTGRKPCPTKGDK